MVFKNQVQTAIDFYNKHPEDTLIVVTADHSTGGFTIGNESTGYETYFDLLNNQKGSQVEFNQIVETDLASKPDMTFEEFVPKSKTFLVWNLMPMHHQKCRDQEDAYREAQEKDRLLCSKEEYEELKAAFEESKKEADDQNVNYGGYIPVSITATRILNKKAGLAWLRQTMLVKRFLSTLWVQKPKMFDGEYDDTGCRHSYWRSNGL